MEDDLQVMQPKQLKVKTIISLKMEDDLNFFIKEDDLISFENRRQPQKNNATKNT